MKRLSVWVAVGGSLVVLAAPITANATPTAPIPSQFGCFPSESRPNFAALPSGTRVFFLPVFAIRYPKPGVDVAEARFSAVNGQLQADIRDNKIYVNGKKTDAALGQGADVNIQTRIEVCVYAPGQAVPANFTTTTPDLVLR
jgi:hypothetical protein